MSSSFNCCSSYQKSNEIQNDNNFEQTTIPRKNFNFGSKNYLKNSHSRFAKFSPETGKLVNAYEIASSIVNMLISCGVCKIKAERAFDVILGSFIRFKKNDKGQFRIDKEKLITNLKKMCEMKNSEARASYALAKAGFKVIFQSHIVKKYDAKNLTESIWDGAMEKVIESNVRKNHSIKQNEYISKILTKAFDRYKQRREFKEFINKNKISSQSSSSSTSNDVTTQSKINKDKICTIKKEKKQHNPLYTCVPQKCKLCLEKDRNCSKTKIHICDHKKSKPYYNHSKDCKIYKKEKKLLLDEKSKKKSLKMKASKNEISCTLHSKHVVCSKVVGRRNDRDPSSCFCMPIKIKDFSSPSQSTFQDNSSRIDSSNLYYCNPRSCCDPLI